MGKITITSHVTNSTTDLGSGLAETAFKLSGVPSDTWIDTFYGGIEEDEYPPDEDPPYRFEGNLLWIRTLNIAPALQKLYDSAKAEIEKANRAIPRGEPSQYPPGPEPSADAPGDSPLIQEIERQAKALRLG